MADIWEDWENDNFEVPVLKTPEQLQRIEERKLVEEEDNALARDLFQDKNDKDDIKCVALQINKSLKLVNNSNEDYEEPTAASQKTEKAVNKQKENEEKQKKLSNKLKEDKFQKERERELFGEVEYDDEYAKYEDPFY